MFYKNCGRNFYSCILGWKGCFYHAENGEFHLAVYSHDNAECGTASRRILKLEGKYNTKVFAEFKKTST